MSPKYEYGACHPYDRNIASFTYSKSSFVNCMKCDEPMPKKYKIRLCLSCGGGKYRNEGKAAKSKRRRNKIIELKSKKELV
jgi:hypothetical protein